MLKRKILALVFALVTLFSVSACGEKIPEGYKPFAEDGMMFDEEGDFVTMYNYCPSVIVDGEDAYVWYCSNKKSGAKHGDHIAYRRGKYINGELYWGEKQILFGPEESTWTSGNVCDPDVIKGEFSYKGETYNWLMTYLGCTTIDNTSNAFGFKVAKSPDGPWIDVPEMSPLYDFYEMFPGYVWDGVSPDIWGWGQSSMISVDKKGKVMLFYTSSVVEGCTKYEYWDFSNLDNPQKLYEMPMHREGIVQRDGITQDQMTNTQFVYDHFNDDIYVICDVWPFERFEVPTNLPNLSRVYRLDNATEGGDLQDFFTNSDKKWERVLDIDKELTGFFRNHNCCFFRDPYGWMLEDGKLEICYTRCLPGGDWKVLYSFRIYYMEYLIPNN